MRVLWSILIRIGEIYLTELEVIMQMNMQQSKKMFVFIALAFLSMLISCTTTRNTTTKDGDSLAPDQGFLAMSITATDPVVLNYINRLNKGHFGIAITDNLSISKGLSYWVIPIPAGEYRWISLDVVDLSGQPTTGNLGANSHFSIKPNTINYIGHIQIDIVGGVSRFRISADNEESSMINYVEKNFPIYSKAFPFKTSITVFDEHINGATAQK